jgi:tetratricopeptide (TPR) repeat protein
LDTLIAKIYPTEKSLMVDKFSMKYFREAEKINLFANAADKYFKKQKNVAATEMNDAAFAIMDGTDEKKLLKKAVKWATTSVEKEPTLTNYETVVGLYYKLGKKSKALNFAKEAIEIGRKSGENYSMMNDWIEKINKL